MVADIRLGSAGTGQELDVLGGGAVAAALGGKIIAHAPHTGWTTEGVGVDVELSSYM
jgi:hypothetical protein